MTQIPGRACIPWIGNHKTAALVKLSERFPSSGNVCDLFVRGFCGGLRKRSRGDHHNSPESRDSRGPHFLRHIVYACGLKPSGEASVLFFTRTTVILWKPSLNEGGRSRSAIPRIASSFTM